MRPGYPLNRADQDELIAELADRAPKVGANYPAWPGLAIFRFAGPAGPMWGEVTSVLLCIVAQGRGTVTVDGETYVHDPFHYLLLGSHVHVQAEVVQAPFLSLVLQIDPALVRQVSGDMLERRTAARLARKTGLRPAQRVCPVALDQELSGALLRFLRATTTCMDRRVLAPLCLQEMIYRLLQREQSGRLVALAAAGSASDPVSAVLEYMRGHLSEPLTVPEMADLASLSPSAFAHLFRDVTGRSPYQYLKEMRLDRARELLAGGDFTVKRISKEVGYASVSHFITEFRGRYGVTPGAYGDLHALR